MVQKGWKEEYMWLHVAEPICCWRMTHNQIIAIQHDKCNDQRRETVNLIGVFMEVAFDLSLEEAKKM